MQEKFEKYLSNNEEAPKEIAEKTSKENLEKRLESTREKLAEVEEKIVERNIVELIIDVCGSLSKEELDILSKDGEIKDLAKKIFELEHSAPTINEAGYTNKEQAEVLKGQLPNLVERKLSEIRQEKAA